MPVRGAGSVSDYLSGIAQAQQTTERARAELTRQAERSLQADQLLQENARLRALLELRARLSVRTRAAEVLYDAPDPYTRKIIIDRGSSQGVQHGSPVINEAGVLGQVTQVYALSAEVTLLSDKDAAIPVLNVRTQQRSAAFGSGDADLMELRFMAGNADVQAGDALTTSGVDGVYPPGLPVARVEKVERQVDAVFARIYCVPLAMVSGTTHVLVLDPLSSQMPARPAPDALVASPKGAGLR